MVDPLIPAKTPFNYNVGINYESWENGRSGYSISADLDQITKYFGLIKTFHDVAVGTANPQRPRIDPTQQQVISHVVKTSNIQLAMGTLNSALAELDGSTWKPGLMTSSAYTDKWVQMIIGAFGSKQAVKDHLKMVLLGNEIDQNGPPPGNARFKAYQSWIKQSFDNLSASLKKAGLGSLPVSTTIANYGASNAVAVSTTSYIQSHWSSTWNGGKPIVLFNQYTPATGNGPASSTDFKPVIDYFGSVDSQLRGKVEPFIGETGYSSFYTLANEISVYKQISTWLNGQYKVGGKTVPMFMFDAFDQPSRSPPFEVQFGIFGQNGSSKPTGLKKGLTLPSWSKKPIANFKSDFDANFRSDVLLHTGDGGLAIWHMNESEVEEAAAVLSGTGDPARPPTSFHVAGSGDFNNDAGADILWRDPQGALLLWEMDGTELLAAAPVVRGGGPALAPPGWQLAGIADFDFDGNADILWRSDTGAAVWNMIGPEVQSVQAILQRDRPANPGETWSIAGAADFDGDAVPEILWRRTNGEVGLWHVDGERLSSYALIQQGDGPANPGTTWKIAGTGDFNGDDLADILWRRDSGEVGIWELDGTQLVAYDQLRQGGAIVNPGSASSIVGTGDYNGDGMSDILWRSGDRLTVWLLNGFQVQSAEVVNDGANPLPLPSGWQIAPT